MACKQNVSLRRLWEEVYREQGHEDARYTIISLIFCPRRISVIKGRCKDYHIVYRALEYVREYDIDKYHILRERKRKKDERDRDRMRAIEWTDACEDPRSIVTDIREIEPPVHTSRIYLFQLLFSE